MPSTRRFRPGLLPSIAAIAGIALTVSLGNWQSGRAAQKQALGRELDAAAHRPALTLAPQLLSARELEFRRLSARGEYSTRHTILLDNKVMHGQAGYQVLTPLRLEGGDAYLLVNRGWIAAGTSRSVLPLLTTPTGMQTVEGIAVVPSVHIFELGGRTEEGSVWQNLVLERYQKWSGLKLQPVVLQQTSPAADGLAREWTRPDLGVNMHRGYAFQWYALATTILVLYVGLSFKRAA